MSARSRLSVSEVRCSSASFSSYDCPFSPDIERTALL